MQLPFHFTIVQTLWTITFAALLVLLLVLVGRERIRRFPFFTASVAITAFQLLLGRLLFGRMAQIELGAISISLSCLSVIADLLVLAEIAHHAFHAAKRSSWLIVTAITLALSVSALILIGPWPGMQAIRFDSYLSTLHTMQFFAEKGGLLALLLSIFLGLLVVFFGRRFHVGWQSHTQRIVIGLSVIALAQISLRQTWQWISTHVLPQTRAEYDHLVALGSRLMNSMSVVYILVLVWWIFSLWSDELKPEQ